jgi:DNA polymerase elongation subunit (family B)
MEIKLLEFREYEVDNEKGANYAIQLFGINVDGETVAISITDYNPCLFIEVPQEFSKQSFLDHLKGRLSGFFKDSIVDCGVCKRRRLYGFDAQCQRKFIFLKFQNMGCFRQIKNLWYTEILTQKTKFNPDGRRWVLNPNGYTYRGSALKIYESNVPPILRFFHITGVHPSGWVSVRRPTYPDEPSTTCEHEFEVSFRDIWAVEKEALSPFKICSFDIEASSSDGDFPLAVKDYRKLAQELVERAVGLPKPEVLPIFFAAFFSARKIVEVLNPTDEAAVQAWFDVWWDLPLASCCATPTVADAPAEEDDDSDGEVLDEKAVNKKWTVCQLLASVETPYAEKTTALTQALNYVFPALQGDKCTFIGSVFYRQGEDAPYLNHCIVLDTCSPVENAEIVSCADERELLLQWQAVIEREDPDIVIGYNTFGFDEQFLFHRALENNCADPFLELCRVRGLKAAEKKNGRYALHEKAVFLASGEYNLKYLKMHGRLQIDLYTVFRRDYNLESYKLDNVSACFIGDKVKKIDAGARTVVHSKNLKGLEVLNYVVFEVVGHTTALHNHGKKYRVEAVHADHFVIEGNLDLVVNNNVRWCLAKDDVDHHDIFEWAKGSADDRAKIARYCLQDCKLVLHLFKKVDMLTAMEEMANVCSVPIDFLVMKGQGIKLTSLISKKCRENGILMPVLPYEESEEGYQGAIVLDPKCGIYSEDPVAVDDFMSLYPSCIISHNQSHDTKVWTKEYRGDELVRTVGSDEFDNLKGFTYADIEYDVYEYQRKTPKAKAEKVKVGTKVCRFEQSTKGIMPTVLEELLKARKATKKLMELEKDDFKKNLYEKRQLAYKLTANSLYGQCGAKTSTFYDQDVAASCTATGRQLLLFAKAVIEEVYDDCVCSTSRGDVLVKSSYVYGDTDSVFFMFDLLKDGVPIKGKDALPYTIELAQEAGKLITQFLMPPHDLEYEKTFFPLVLLSKKRYVGMLYETDLDKCYQKSMGIVLKRRDNADIVKDVYGGVVDILMQKRNVVEAVAFVRQHVANLRNGFVGIEKLIITKALRSGYKKPQQIAHKVLADRVGARDPGNKPRPGDRIEFVYVKGAKKALQGEKIETPEYIFENKLDIDYEHYITNQIMKPLQQLFALVLADIPGFDQRSFDAQLSALTLEGEKLERKVEQIKMKTVQTLVF